MELTLRTSPDFSQIRTKTVTARLSLTLRREAWNTSQIVLTKLATLLNDVAIGNIKTNNVGKSVIILLWDGLPDKISIVVGELNRRYEASISIWSSKAAHELKSVFGFPEGNFHIHPWQDWSQTSLPDNVSTITRPFCLSATLKKPNIGEVISTPFSFEKLPASFKVTSNQAITATLKMLQSTPFQAKNSRRTGRSLYLQKLQAEISLLYSRDWRKL